MKKYKLLKDLPTFKAGEIFRLDDEGNECLYWHCEDQDDEATRSQHWDREVMAYHRATIEKFPNILTDWFEEIKEESTTWTPVKDEYYYCVNNFGYVDSVKNYNEKSDIQAQEIGNVFRSEKDAKKAVEWLKARKTLLDDAGGVNRGLGHSGTYAVCWCGHNKKLAVFSGDMDILSDIMFTTRDEADASIKKHAKEWRIYLGVDE